MHKTACTNLPVLLPHLPAYSSVSFCLLEAANWKMSESFEIVIENLTINNLRVIIQRKPMGYV